MQPSPSPSACQNPGQQHLPPQYSPGMVLHTVIKSSRACAGWPWGPIGQPLHCRSCRWLLGELPQPWLYKMTSIMRQLARVREPDAGSYPASPVGICTVSMSFIQVLAAANLKHPQMLRCSASWLQGQRRQHSCLMASPNHFLGLHLLWNAAEPVRCLEGGSPYQ